jgi:acyl-coenzyme A synthetase/AMP-(fatty) acid ligase
VIPFTSGTTGDPVPHPKTLSSLMGSASLINRQLGGAQGVRMVATVPPQHMYGLELTLLLPLFEGAILDWRRPFFPGDVVSALRDGPTPVALVTTPLHLRALLSLPDEDLPEVAFIVSATAPLPLELAREAEARFSAPLHEVYGCTELGSIAGRRPVDSEVWHWYSGVECTAQADGHHVRAAHVISPATVSDQLEILSDATFLLRGRNADLVNIAGKRASIRALERAALEIQGVRDVAFIQGDEAEGSVGRLSALVVLDPEVSLASVKAALRRDLDPAFVPRPLIEVPSLPRNAMGKLPRAKLLAFLAEVR